MPQTCTGKQKMQCQLRVQAEKLKWDLHHHVLGMVLPERHKPATAREACNAHHQIRLMTLAFSKR